MNDLETMRKIMQFVPFAQRLHASCLIGKTYPHFTDDEKECIARTLNILKEKEDEVKQLTFEKWDKEKEDDTSKQQS